MNAVLRNILAVILGLFIGGVVNMGIITISGDIVPLPQGVNPSDMESIRAAMGEFQPRHFLMPFLAHALGTLVGALITALVGSNRKMFLALVVGVFFLIGGIINTFMLPVPIWFVVVDLVLAYLPMAWLGAALGSRK